MPKFSSRSHPAHYSCVLASFTFKNDSSQLIAKCCACNIINTARVFSVVVTSFVEAGW